LNTNIHFWSYLAQLFLEWETVQTKVVEKIKPYILCPIIFFSFRNHTVYEILWKKHCRAGQAIDDSKAHAHCMVNNWGYKNTHSEYVILMLFYCNNGCRNACHCHVMRALPVLFFIQAKYCFQNFVIKHPHCSGHCWLRQNWTPEIQSINFICLNFFTGKKSYFVQSDLWMYG